MSNTAFRAAFKLPPVSTPAFLAGFPAVLPAVLPEGPVAVEDGFEVSARRPDGVVVVASGRTAAEAEALLALLVG
jgi:hypothetical protein